MVERGSYRKLIFGQDKKSAQKRTEIFALIAVCCLYCADAVELYLPSVITHPVSCDLNLSQAQELILALALYVSLAAFILLTIPVSNRFGRRTVILVAIYLSIITTVICSVVPNFATLLLSRILVGVTVAINISTIMVYLAEICVNDWFAVLALSLSLFMYAIGSGWGGVLGYLLLESIGWRYLIVLASTPLYIPPLILFHFFLPESKRPDPVKTDDYEKMEMEKKEESANPKDDRSTRQPVMTLKKAVAFTIKICINVLSFSFVQNGAVLLIPAIYKEKNLGQNEIEIIDTNPCGHIHGSQFLTLSLIFGCCSIVGRAVNYITHRRLSTGIILLINSTITLGCLISIKVYREQYNTIFMLLGLIQGSLASSAQETCLVSTNADHLTSKYIAMVAGTYNAIFFLAFIATSAVSISFCIDTVIYIHIGLTIVSMISATWIAIAK